MADLKKLTKKLKIQLRNDVATAWQSKNPVLLKGELGFDQTSKYIKIGDGVTAWNSLSTVRLPKTAIDDLADINENTLYSLSASADGSKFALLSADGTLAIPTYSEVTAIAAKDWTETIKLSADAAQKAGELSAQSVRDSLTAYVKYDDVKTKVTADNKVVTEADIADLTNVMHFIGTVTPDDGETDAAAAVTAYPKAKKGDVIISTKSSKEYVYVSDTAGDVNSWREFGDESTYASDADLKAEKTLRAADDQVLSNAITAIQTDLTSKYNELTADDTFLSGKIDDLSGDLTAYAKQADLTAEIEARKAADTVLSTAIDNKVKIDDASAATLNVKHVTGQDYHNLVKAGTLDNSTLYVVSSDTFSAYGEKIVNVATPTEDTDAANKKYVDDEVKKVNDLAANSISAISINGDSFDVADHVASFTFDAIDCGDANS